MSHTKFRKTNFLLVLTLLTIAFFFRFWKLKSFQYWSDDEQLLWSIVRHIVVDKHPSLVTPNVALGVGLGPLLHHLVAPWFWLVKFDPLRIVLLGNLFTFLNVILIYIAGDLLGGKKVGFIAGFLYAASFISSLFDRRLWALSPNFSMVTLAIISLIQILRGKSIYLILLVMPVVFSLNSDPSLGVVTLASVAALLFFGPKINKKHILYSAIFGVLLLSPLIIFEFRHSGQNIKSLLSVNIGENTANSEPFALAQLKNFSRFFYAQNSNSADAYFCYCTLDDSVSPLLIILVAVMILGFTHPVLIFFLISYLIGIFVFRTFLGGNPTFFYSLTISPVLFLIAGTAISKIKYLLLLLPIFLLVNFHSLSFSSFKYPLTAKIQLVEETIAKLPNKNNFSLYYSGDVLNSGGGWTSLFMSQGATPVKGSLSAHWGHVYETYNLYPISFSKEEPKNVVVVSGKDAKIYNKKVNLEELYQPKYFE